MTPQRLRALLHGLVFLLVLAPSAALAQRQPEKLGRAVIAERGVDSGGNGTNNWSGAGVNQVYVGWRLLATDPEGISFNVYRSANGAAAVKLNASPITTSTNYVDTTATLTVPNAYSVKPVISGVEGAASEAWTLPANSIAEPCFTIPTPLLADGTHYVHLAWAGDLDGDGFPDIVIDRLPTTTGTIRVEAYSTRTRSQLWSIDCGPNSAGIISAGQNDGVTVFDFDGDGKCEVVIKSIAGTVFGNGTVLPGSGTTVYLSVVDGTTGAERSRFQVATAIAASTDAKNIGVGFLDGIRPALIVMDEAHDFNAYDINPATMALSLRWKCVSPTSPYPHGHGIRIGDIDGDGKDEVSDIGMAIDDNGTLLYQNELNHGDRYHIADIDPDRPGLECFAVQQDNPTQLNYVLFDALTGQMLWRKYAATQVDNGRGNIGSIDSAYTGMQGWSASGGLVDQFGNSVSSNLPSSCNFSIWWDADPLRETLDRQIVEKWNVGRLLTGYNFEGADYSWRDAVPFYGDILGDWREEIVTDSGDGTKLVIFSTTKVASSRYYTLLQDPQYRDDLTIKGYMQSHHPGFYFGQNMPRAPRAPVWNGDLTWVGNAGSNVWDTTTARWKNSATGAATNFANGQSVLFDLTGVSSTAVTLTGTLSPSQVVVHTPKNQVYTFGGAGTLTGSMPLAKGGQGSLTLTGSHSFAGQTIVSEGTLIINGSITGSPVRVDSRGVLSGTGTISQIVSFPEVRGGLVPGGIGSVGTLTLSGGLSETGGTVNTFDLASSTAAGSNDRVAVTGNLTLSGANIIQINPLNGTLAAGGTYTLFTYTGTYTGTLASLIIRGADAYACTLANTGSAITLTVGTLRSAAAITWNGGTGGVWKLNGGTGWLKGGVADGFVTGDTVTFDSSGTATLSTTVLPAATVINSAANFTFSGTGAIGGSGGLTKSGAGTLTLSTANTYTGPTTINGGVVSVASLADGGQPSPIGAASVSAANLVLNGGTLRLSGGSTSTFRGATLGSSGGTLDLPSSTSTLNLSGILTGTGSLTKSGPGLLILNAVNTYAGGTVIQGGRVVLTASREDNSPTSPIQYGLGTGAVTLQGGTLSLSDTSQGDLDYVDSRAFWPIVVPTGAAARLELNGRMNLGGALTGAGDLTFFTPYIRTDVTGNWSAFTGRLYIVTDGDGGDFRIANSAGLSGAWLDLAANVWTYSRAGTGTTTINIGSLSGAAGSGLNAGTGSGAGANQPAHWRIGARGDDTTFAGIIGGTSLVTKQGPGTLTLTGANTYTGATTVTAGKLVLAGGSLSGSAITVQSGAGFGGAGSVTGNVTFNSGSILLAASSGPLAITGNLTLGGPVTVVPVSGAAYVPGSYLLYTYTGTLTGTPSFTWSGAGFTGTFDTSVSGQVTLILQSASAVPPTNLIAVPGDGKVTLGWTASATAVSYTVRRSTTNGGPYTDVATGVTALSFLDTGLTNGTTYYYEIGAVNGGGQSADSPQASATPSTLWVQIKFNETSGTVAADSSGHSLNATTFNGPTWAAGLLGNALTFTQASSQYATLPAGVVSNLTNTTLMGWVKTTSLATSQRIFDFGTGPDNSMFLTTQYAAGADAAKIRFGIRTPSVAEQSVSSSIAMPTGTWTHVAVVLNGGTGTLYLNGVQVGQNTAMTLKPSDLGNTTLNYLGKSQSPDPYLNAALDDFRIYSAALDPAAVQLIASACIARLTFDETSGTTAADATGNGWKGTLVNTPTWTPGILKNAVTLSGTSQHVTLPTGVAGGLNDFTISTWVKMSSITTQARIFDFGTGTAPGATTGSYMFLAPSNGSVIRFAMTTAGYNNEQAIAGTAPLVTGTWVHVAVTLTGSTGRLYLNGTQVGINAAMTLKPSSLGSTTLNYLGRSQFAADPYLNGSLDDFRIYSRALGASELTAMANPTAEAPENLTAIPDDGKVNLSWTVPNAATSYTVRRSQTSGGPYTPVAGGTGLTATSFIDTGLANGTTYYYVVTGNNSLGAGATSPEVAATPSSLRVHLKFDETSGTVAADSSGRGINATTFNGPTWGVGKFGNALTLTQASSQYATLPTGVVSGLTTATIMTWVKISTVATWQRIFDFGTGVDNYMFLTTQYSATAGSTNKLRFAIRTPGVAETAANQINSSTVTPTGTWAHVAVVFNGSTGTLYLNGVQVGQSTTMTLNPASLGSTTLNYLGKSQFADPYLNGSLDDFRIYSRAMTAGEVSLFATPLAAPQNVITTTPAALEVDLNWNAVPNAASYNVKASTVSGGPYTTLATGLTSPTYAHTGLTLGVTRYYIVTAVNLTGEGPASAEISAAPLDPPAAPASLTATVGNATVSLAWSATATASSYIVKRSSVSGGSYTNIATGITATSYTDPGLTNGTAYYYVVSAVNVAGQSPDSTESSATPLPPAPPAPTGLTATADNSQIALAWTAASGADSYNVKRSTTSGGAYADLASGITATSYADTGVTVGVTYYYVVSAVNAGGESPDSAEAGASVTSAPITEAECAAPSLVLGNGNSAAIATATSVTGHLYQLQSCTDLVSGDWIDVGAPVAGTGAALQFKTSYDPLEPRRFYRIFISR